ncbi:hypothetical protein Rumeso_03645 [Rubellimicrobium mesophilum DSM 19309]|uniref:Uncharacterized protein n=1 Tax=Rubellimicrobium mesophilum DSM 19309 TaxID=442562 RepID=A0A017HJU1_9RHOB|nr:hypothetical protein [Rubellimicrobium mesophilum]EYD74782.1 hypothetical protein Rumeso_03645 [Rubellimicrobium mesophilum DSM 19309]
MHRFATEYFPRAVAVNDLGWVSYRNDNYVLDLWGLGSEEAREAMRSDSLTSEFVREVAVRHGVTYAMIYKDVFRGSIPGEWCEIAELRTSKVTAFEGEVAFYLLRPEEETAMRRALASFEESLPEGSSLGTFDCDGDDGGRQTS